jgi:hypothetical protein
MPAVGESGALRLGSSALRQGEQAIIPQAEFSQEQRFAQRMGNLLNRVHPGEGSPKAHLVLHFATLTQG